MSMALTRLLHLCDSTLPIGGFSHSAGLETYVQKGLVNDKATAKAFITAMLSRSIHYTDAAFVSLAFDAIKENDLNQLITLDEECSAVKLTAETRQASRKMGQRLLKIFQPIGNYGIIDQFKNKMPGDGGNQCIIFGMVAQLSGIEKQDALQGFYYAALAAMVTNCVKLIPLGQQDGQAMLYELMPMIHRLAEQNLEPDLNSLGLCCPGFDIRSMQHEQLYSRLYMS